MVREGEPQVGRVDVIANCRIEVGGGERFGSAGSGDADEAGHEQDGDQRVVAERSALRQGVVGRGQQPAEELGASWRHGHRRNDGPQQSGAVEAGEDRPRLPSAETLRQLVGDARRRCPVNLSPHRGDRLAGFGVEPEPEPSRVLDRAHHSHGILGEAAAGRTDRPHHTGLEVGETADVVDHSEVGDAVEHAVDREIPPPGVLLGGSELLGLRDRRQHVGGLAFLHLGRFGRAAKRGDLDDLAAESDPREPKTTADQSSVAEKLSHLLRARICPDVEVLRASAQEQVADCAADQIGNEPGPVQAVQDLKRALRDRVA